MRKPGLHTVLLLASVALSVVVLFFGSYMGSIDSMSKATAATANPNIVFILTDDMRKGDLKYMPQTRTRLRDKGKYFHNAFVSNPICCPSRATIMRGQYAHNTHVWTNVNGPNGGWKGYQANGLEGDNVATRLHDAGYRTGLFGKYLNQYFDGTTHVPPKWDRWFATQGGYFNYDMNANGNIIHFGSAPSDYQTDVLSERVNTFIRYSDSLNKPFFAYVAPIAPHAAGAPSVPATPAPRDLHTHDGLQAPRLPSFNEPIVSDKPSWMRSLPPLTNTQKANIDKRHENRAESLQAVDDLVAGVLDTLNARGVMNNTYIFFTSDNGWFHGEHRVPVEKYRPYEEDIRVPLVVRGPGITAGSTTKRPVLNTDYLPTFTDLSADAQRPPYVDGRSLRPLLNGTATTWRDAILIEGPAYNTAYNTVPPYRGIRTLDANTQRKYVEYGGTSQTEMYYLGVDPYELDNESVPAAGLASRLQALKTCRPEHLDINNTTVSCSVAENGP